MKQTESIGVSRRQLLAMAGSTAAIAICTHRLLSAKDVGIVPTMIGAAARAKITTQTIRRNISVLEGSGGNVAVLTGRDGKLLVGAGFSVSRPAITAALASINDDPIRHLINTHWHPDHTDGNAWLHDAGAEITAHENTQKRLSIATRVEGWQWTFPQLPPVRCP